MSAEIILILTTITLSSLTLLPLVASDHWFSRVWEFPRIQLIVLLIVNIAASIHYLNSEYLVVMVLANSLCLVYQIAWVLPYTPLVQVQVPILSASNTHTTSVKMITSNVLMPNRSAQKLIDLVNQHQPDVLVTLESNQWWQDALSCLHHVYTYRVNRPLENLYGMHVYSKFPLEDIELVDLIEENVPSVHCKLRITDDTYIKCHFLHPAPPSPTENETAKPRDRELLLVAKRVAGSHEPTIVTGDLNDVAWSPTTRKFRKVSGLMDPRIGRGLFNTFHAKYPFARWPLDHIFHSSHFALKTLERLPSIDSDHFPLMSELVFDHKKIKKDAK